MLREEWTTGGQWEESRTAGGVEDMVRSRGQQEDSRTAEETRTAGGVEDSGRSGGHQEILKRVVSTI